MTAKAMVRTWDSKSRGHLIGAIKVRNVDRLGSERYSLNIQGDTMFLRPDENGYSARNNKIQLWKEADLVKDWDGVYPLEFHPEDNSYSLKREEREANWRYSVSQSVPRPNYTPHTGNRRCVQYEEPVDEPKQEETPSEEPENSRPSEEKIEIAKEVLTTLCIEAAAEGQSERATLFANALKAMM